MTILGLPVVRILALCACAVLTAESALGQTAAPYRPLPAGSVLDYGSWRCTVRPGPVDMHVCAGPDGAVASFFAKLVPVGDLPRSGYASNMTKIHCEIPPTLRHVAYEPATLEIEHIELDRASRQAVRALWPLAVGKKAAFKRRLRKDDEPAESEIKVVERRSATVAGAPRTVYVLRGHTRNVACYVDMWSAQTLVTFDETWWYAPDVGAVVHYEINWPGIEQKGQNVVYDLKSFSVPGGAAVANAAPRKPATRPAPAPPTAAPPRLRPPAPAAALPSSALDREAPVIEVPSRLDADGALVRLGGRVTDSSRVIELTVNGAPVPLGGDGAFEVRRGVPLGTSRIEIAAIDEWGNRARRTVTVVRAARAPARPGKPAASAALPADPLAGIHFGAYHALVIGNDKYRHLPKLRSASKDAWSVSALLTAEYGFRVRTMIDATRSQILGALAALRGELKADDNLLVYYGGHGVVDSVTEQGYWLPVDAEETNPANWISNSDLTDMLRGMRARHVLVVADSCYSGTLVRAAQARIPTSRDQVAWLKRMLRQRARTALVSGGLEPVVDGGGDGHSVFAKALLNALKSNDGIMEGRALFNAIKRPVVLNADQTPQYSDIRRAGHEGGEFIFYRRRTR